jgi:hypothetical protein
VILYWAARLPTISQQERQQLAGQFHFVRQDLPDVAGAEQRNVRPVHPSLDHISAWISAVGAAAALGDLDGDQFPNDVCYIDTRTDQVIVAPAPGISGRYEPFALDAGRLYDRATMAPTHCLPRDLNEDGLTDVLVSYWGRTPIAFLRRSEPTSSVSELHAASYEPVEIAPGGERWYTDAATTADVDGDGHVDVIVGNYFQDGARILDPTADGIESMQHSMSRAYNGGRNRLLLWAGGTSGERPTVEFRDASDALDFVGGEPTGTAWTLAIGAADLDGDLLPEIYFGNDFGPDRLLHNLSLPGQPRFALLSGHRTMTVPRSKVLGHDSFKGMGVDFGDLNGDGLLDMYVSNIASEYALEESHFVWVSTGDVSAMAEGRAPYVDEGERLGLSRSGWGWDSRLADFDNDGQLEAIQATGFLRGERNCWPELHETGMGNDQLLSDPRQWHRFQPGEDMCGSDPNPFYVRAADGRFYDLSPELGMDDAQVTRAVAVADVDGDGDLDFVYGNQWEPSRYYLNDCPRPGRFLGLRLLLPVGDPSADDTEVFAGHESPPVPARPAIGAAATVHLPGGKMLVGQVDGGSGHSGVRSAELHFGLGDVPDDAVLRVDLRWRDAHGSVRDQSIELKPGWRTVLLGETPGPRIGATDQPDGNKS